ncbi:MAG: hypothetical protein GY859_27025 [Desulfobacterales bacterium]|nr:hypothetical protein [Desulfobacterales bacterium]
MTKVEKNLKLIHEHMSTHIEGFVASGVVNLEDGLSVSSLCIDPEVHKDDVTVYLASVVNSHFKAAELISDTRETNEILFTAAENHYIIRVLSKQRVFFYVMAGDAGGAETRKLLMEKYEVLVIKTLGQK